jgi:hypothetical protein
MCRRRRFLCSRSQDLLNYDAAKPPVGVRIRDAILGFNVL